MIGLEGSVGFDESLDLRASVPITKGMLGSAAGLDDLVGDGKVDGADRRDGLSPAA